MVGMKGYQGRVIVMLIVHDEQEQKENRVKWYNAQREKGPFFICFGISDLLPSFCTLTFFQFRYAYGC